MPLVAECRYAYVTALPSDVRMFEAVRAGAGIQRPSSEVKLIGAQPWTAEKRQLDLHPEEEVGLSSRYIRVKEST